MKACATITVTLATENAARAVADALSPENAGYVAQTVDGRTVTATVEADATGRLRATLDDYLACLAAAEKAVGAASERNA